MSKYPYTEEQIYAGPTYGCWTDSGYVYCFTPHGVDVYNLKRISDVDRPAESAMSYISAYSVMDGYSVNEMCRFDNRLLYATTNGLYASIDAEKYNTVVDFTAKDIQFYHNFSVSGDTVFMFYDGNAFYRYNTVGKT